MMKSLAGLRFTPSKVLSLLLLVGMMPSQAASPAFTSRYTDFDKDCDTPKWVTEEIVGWERKHPGQEYPYPEPEIMDCKPVAGWRASMSWSVAAMNLSVGPQKRERNYTEDVLIGSRLGTGTKYAPLEWRMADGKPFAVIFRIEEWQDNPEWKPENSAPQFIVTGEKLIVRGLGRYARLNLVFSAKDPLANQKAHAAADAAYKTLKP